MKDITIADIRHQANDILTLNSGHIIYQKKQYQDYIYKITKYHGIVLEGQCSFSDATTNLSVGDIIHSNCSCNSGFCKHKVALYFLLKDTQTDLRRQNYDMEALATYDINLVMKSFVDELKANFHKYDIHPLVSLQYKQVKLALSVIVDGKRTTINDIYSFVETYKNHLLYTSSNTSFPNGRKYYKEYGVKLIELLMLFDNKNNLYPASILEQIYNIYKDDYIYLEDNRFRKIKFKDSEFPVKLKYEERQVILRESVSVFPSLTKSFVLYDDVFYAFDNTKDSKILSLLTFDRAGDVIFSFEEENEILFYTIIYDGLEEYFSLEEDKIITVNVRTKLAFNSYLELDYDVVDQDGNVLVLSVDPIKLVNYQQMLETFGFESVNGKYILNDEEKIVDILSEHLGDFSHYGELYVDESCKKVSKFRSTSFDYRFSLDTSFFELVFQDLTYSKEELSEIFSGYKLKKKYVKLADGNLVSLDDEGYDLYKLFQDFDLLEKDLKKEIQIPFYQFYKLSAFKRLMKKTTLFDTFYEEFISYSNEKKLKEEWHGILRDYQIKGFNWLSVLYKYNLGGILADDMGLGKTIEIIAFLSAIDIKKPVLIVSPTSLVLNWQSEFERFAPHLPIKVVVGSASDRKTQIDKIKDSDIILTSYESVRIGIEDFAAREYEVIIADEAQYLKNPSAYKTQAMKRLKSKCNFALTGTPIENNIMDLWSIFDFILPGYLPNKRDFLSIYSANTLDLQNLAKQVQPFILRREKQNVLSLPPKYENNVYAFLEGDQLRAYEAYLHNVQQELSDSDYSIPYVLRTLIRLREFMCEPRLFIDNYKGGNAKLDMLMEILDESIIDGHRVLLFSSFPSVFKYIIKELEKKEIAYDVLDGKTPKEVRLEKVNEFNQNEKIKVFLISLKVGGSGLNLHGADMVIHYDPWWNIAATNQATDRAYRFGQTKPVHVIKLIVKDSIEEKIMKLQEKKARLSSDIITDSALVKQLSKEELIDLFGGK